MPIAKIQTPDGKVISLEVPEGATEAQIMQFLNSQDLSQFNQAPQGVDPDVPTAENIAADPVPTVEQESGIVDNITGAIDAATTLGTAATGGTVGTLAGFAQGVGEQIFGDGTQQDTFDLMSEYAGALTREPKTKEGKEFVENIARLAGGLPPVLGTSQLTGIGKSLNAGKISAKARIKDVSDVIKTLNPVDDVATLNKLQEVLPPSITKSPRAKRAVIAEQIRSGSPNTDLVTKTLTADGNLVTGKTSKRALDVLNRSIGDVDAAKTVSTIENMTPYNKSEVGRVLKIVDDGRKSGVFGDINRPSDILGEAVATIARDIFRLNEKAGQEIGNTARSIKQNVDISAPSNKFLNSLSEMGVTFKQGDDGWITPDFSRSKFMGGSQKDMTVLINDLMNKTPDFETAHKLKQQIRDNVSYDVAGASQLKGQSEKLLKDLSREINDVLVSKSDKYAKANNKFAETIKLKEDFAKLAGKDIDIFSDVSDKALGTKAKRLTSNAQSRAPMIQLLTNADEILKKNGIRLKSDIGALAHVTNQIEKAFKIAPQNSLKGNLVTAGVDVVDATTSPIATARGFGNYLKEMTKPDYNKTMRAFKSLTQQGNK